MKNNAPTPNRFLHWFDPRNQGAGTIAFIINRVSGIGLTFYLILHLIVLSKLASGSQAYDSFVALAKSPIIMAGELLVIAGGVIHGLNGIRITLNSFGVFTRIQKELFAGLMVVSIVIIVLFGIRMFSGA